MSTNSNSGSGITAGVVKASPIIFTQAASDKALELISEEQNSNLKLRAFVTGGGCSGFQYGFAFEEEQNEDDLVIEKNGVSLLVDSLSFQYLVGSKVDYKEDLDGSRFVVENPNATTTCGCGSSFSI
ncbi:MAG: iron-sulfur cluster insertion protein ErpA [Kangiellaceae bacterium]|nr:iron-sulfur cluster insertion protein ErpA [Kangiellaceae bacterium]